MGRSSGGGSWAAINRLIDFSLRSFNVGILSRSPTFPPCSSSTKTGATATLPFLDHSTLGEKSPSTSSTLTPSISLIISNVLRYSLQNPWMPASTGRSLLLLYPPARPPFACFDASNRMTSTLSTSILLVEIDSQKEYPAQPPPTTTTRKFLSSLPTSSPLISAVSFSLVLDTRCCGRGGGTGAKVMKPLAREYVTGPEKALTLMNCDAGRNAQNPQTQRRYLATMAGMRHAAGMRKWRKRKSSGLLSDFDQASARIWRHVLPPEELSSCEFIDRGS
mmetsp:Transcript_12713/g.31023  ORF Transcript_12713/g.31023 Transcript_12713/m.31023 type:complete len:277 (-) Transcript_12713:22-852(-)